MMKKELTRVSCKRPKSPKGKVQKDQSSINKFLSIIESTATPLKEGLSVADDENVSQIQNFVTFESFSMDSVQLQLKNSNLGVIDKREGRRPPTKSNLA